MDDSAKEIDSFSSTANNTTVNNNTSSSFTDDNNIILSFDNTADNTLYLDDTAGTTLSCNNTADSSNTDFHWDKEGGRGCRSKRKHSDPICCPVCGLTLRVSEVESHLIMELQKLGKVATQKHKSNGRSSSSSSESGDKNWDIFKKIRLNRQSRQRYKAKKRKAEEELRTCPICNIETKEDITLHVDQCLRRNRRNSEESDATIDVEAYEEYEWAGQSRVRLTSFLPGGVLNGTSLSMAEEDEDLNVDGDEMQVYGMPQYTEKDVILLPCGDPENVALRKAVTGSDPEKSSSNEDDESSPELVGDPLVMVLKSRIRELESREQNKEEIHKCLICMERYRTPVISVCCWHVHCERCWLQTLGAKKLCPQCNMITSPADLRKIYM